MQNSKDFQSLKTPPEFNFGGFFLADHFDTPSQGNAYQAEENRQVTHVIEIGQLTQLILSNQEAC